jgi:hypothetical protein
LQFAIFASLLALALLASPAAAQDPPTAAPRPPASVTAADHSWDDGQAIDVTFVLSPDDDPAAGPKPIERYVVLRAGEYGGLYTDAGGGPADAAAHERGAMTVTVPIEETQRGEPFWFRVYAVGPGGVRSAFAETTEPVRAERQWFDGGRMWLAIVAAVVCGAVVVFIALARRGINLFVRKIAGLEAIEEAVGRATEMGRPCLFIPGIQDMNEIQTIAGLTILARVAQRAAEYDAIVEVPTSRSLVMTAARETVQAAYLTAGRPDGFNEDRIYYVTDEQFGYVAYLAGHMVREKPAACFYMGSFFAESLILAETGNSVGAIQVAGTAQPSQLPFFVAACDYTLIGEEFFAASAYLSGDPDQLGSLKGQDVGKLIVAALLVIGCGLFTLAAVSGSETVQHAAIYLRDTILSG